MKYCTKKYKSRAVSRSGFMRASAEAQRALTIKSPLPNQYHSLLYDEMQEVLVPTSIGDYVRAIDICWQVARGESITNACISMGVHPIKFMVYRYNHPRIDEIVRAACELAGENDVKRAEQFMLNITNGNYELNMAKSKFFVWRGKQRYAALYGERPQVSIDASRTMVTNTFQLATTIRQLADDQGQDVKVIDGAQYEES